MTYLYSLTSTIDLLAATVLWLAHLVLVEKAREAVALATWHRQNRMATWAAWAGMYCLVEAFSWPILEGGVAWFINTIRCR
jgi:hypothetical protein